MKPAHALAIGVLVRMVLIPFVAHPIDIYFWYEVIIGILTRGPSIVTFFPPMLFYTFIPLAYLFQFASHVFGMGTTPMQALPTALDMSKSVYAVPLVPGLLFNVVSKSPFLVGDVLIGLTLYCFAGKIGSPKIAARALTIWILNPYVLWISSGWGNFDALPALFSILSVGLLINKRLKTSALTLAIATAFKLYPALFLFSSAVFITKRCQRSKKALLNYLSTYLFSLLLLMLPSISLAAHSLQLLLSRLTGLEPLGFGLTYWSVALLVPISPTMASILSNGLLVLLLALSFWKTLQFDFKRPLLDLAKSQLSCILAIYLTQVIIPEQFYVWSLPYVVILSVVTQVKERIYWIGSGIALLYALTNVIPPFYLLPLAAVSAPIAMSLASIATLLSAYRIRVGELPGAAYAPKITYGTVYLATLGTVFSLLMLFLEMDILVGRDFTFRAKRLLHL